MLNILIAEGYSARLAGRTPLPSFGGSPQLFSCAGRPAAVRCPKIGAWSLLPLGD